MATYVFTLVNTDTATPEEISDEERRICEVRPFLNILKLERKKDQVDDHLNSQISQLIGKGNLMLNAKKTCCLNNRLIA